MKILVPLFYLIFFPFLTCAQQNEEGWRWKKTFVVQHGGQLHQVDDLHEKMAKEVSTIQQIFERLTKNHEEVIDPIRQCLRDNQYTHSIFRSLNADEMSIGNVLDEDSSGKLGDYWLDGVDFPLPSDPTLQEKNKKIITIIQKNLQRLNTRNIVIASLGTVIDGSYEQIPVRHNECRAIFLSGRGNRLVELLESKFFPNFTFVTFDRPYDDVKSYEGFLLGNLGYILAHDSPRIPQILKSKSIVYKAELDSYIAATKQLQKVGQSYDKDLKELSIPSALGDRTLIESVVKDSQRTLRNNLGKIIELERKLQDVQASYQTAQRLVPDFYHSEQLLRLFLYNNLDPLLIVNEFLTLHLHSSNDVCERCAHCLFLESEMCNVNTQQSRPKIKKKGAVEDADPYGFFEKFFNSVKETRANLKYQIMASSSIVGERRGVQHRYQSGHDLQPSKPINLDVFPPLMAFKMIPHNFNIEPLPPSLAGGDSDAAAAAVSVLHQSYFPNVPHH